MRLSIEEKEALLGVFPDLVLTQLLNTPKGLQVMKEHLS